MTAETRKAIEYACYAMHEVRPGHTDTYVKHGPRCACAICEDNAKTKEINGHVAALTALLESGGESEAQQPVGWVYKVIINKHLTGEPKPGQIQISGVWGDKSEHLYFTTDRPAREYVWWESPVYLPLPPAAKGGK